MVWVSGARSDFSRRIEIFTLIFAPKSFGDLMRTTMYEPKQSANDGQINFQLLSFFLAKTRARKQPESNTSLQLLPARLEEISRVSKFYCLNRHTLTEGKGVEKKNGGKKHKEKNCKKVSPMERGNRFGGGPRVFSARPLARK